MPPDTVTDNRPGRNVTGLESSWQISHLANVGFALTETAYRMPNAVAVAAPTKNHWRLAATRINYRQVTFSELEQLSNQIARGASQLGIAAGTRLALLVPPGIEFVSLVFGLFKTGAVIILIDPGMGRSNLLRCLSAAEPDGMFAVPLAHLLRTAFRSRFPKCRLNIVVGSPTWPGCRSAAEFRKLESSAWSGPGDQGAQYSPEDPAAIIFTSGSTGPPKGALYHHRTFLEQVQQIRDYFGILPGGVDVSGFPLFALFNAAMGTTTVFPKMDSTRPANVYPPHFIDAVRQFAADQSFGSPALWNTVSRHCQRSGITLPSLKTILTAGSPVSPDLLERVKSMIAPDGEVYTPFGATEAMPIACNTATAILSETAARTRLGHGICVGSRFSGIQWKIIRITDGPIRDLKQAELLGVDEIGELIVEGPGVTAQYVTCLEANALHKIFDRDGDGQVIWHRMGDVGYLDQQDRFWFCGRKSQRVCTPDATLFTIPCESIINTHPAIYRSALVGVGQPGMQLPVIIAQPHPEHWPRAAAARQKLLDELHRLSADNATTRPVEHFMLRRELPVDTRHNSKIFREKLAVWAARQLKSRRFAFGSLKPAVHL